VIVCHCQQITDRDILAAIAWMRSADPQAIVTPGRLYHALGKTPDCGGCMSHFVAVMRDGLDRETPEVPRLTPRAPEEERRHERR